MKSTTLASLLFLTAAACQNSASKLDKTTGGLPQDKGAASSGAGGSIGGGGSIEGAAAMKEVNDLKRKLAEFEGQVNSRIERVNDKVTDYDKYKTPLDAIATKIKADEGKYTIPDGIMFDTRIKAIEASIEKNAEMLEWLGEVYEQQQQQAPLDPSGLWAIDVEPAVKAGQVEGPIGAFVTIVEAWDYA